MAKHTFIVRKFGNADEVDSWVKRVDDLQAHHGHKEHWQFHWDVFAKGIETMESDLSQQGELTDPVVIELRRIAVEQKDQAGRLAIYDHVGEPEFQAWCDQHDIDPEPTLRRAHSNLTADHDRRTHEQRWLDDFLVDGQAYETTDIRTAAVADRIIQEDDEVGWHRFENYASTRRYTCNAPRGQWCRQL